MRLRAREAELLASRARVVEAADEERRRIGRDLHDGVQQQLVALTQRVDVALRALADRGHAARRDVLRDAREQAATAGRELRELAHGLHPVGLSERGLDGALRPARRASPRCPSASSACPTAGCPRRSS